MTGLLFIVGMVAIGVGAGLQWGVIGLLVYGLACIALALLAEV